MSKIALGPIAIFPLSLIAFAIAGCPDTTETTDLGGQTSAASSGPSTGTGGNSTATTSTSSTSTGHGGASTASTGNGGGGGSVTSTGNGGGGGSVTSTGNGGATAASTTAASSSTGSNPTYDVGGNVHFLQSGTLVLKNGADTATITVNGGFNFPTKVADNTPYDVTVSSSPPNQECWVQNGAGTVTGDVSTVVVDCTTILQATTTVGPAVVVASSPTLTAIPDIAPITFTNDIPADVLMSINIPWLEPLPTGSTLFHIAFQLDGATIYDADYEPERGGTPLPASTLTIQSLAAGTHQLTPLWSMASGTLLENTQTGNSQTTSEMDVVILESLPSFDHVFTQSLAANAGATSLANTATTPAPMGFAMPMINVPGSAQPVFASLMANDFRGDRYAASLTLDGQSISASTMIYDVNGQHARSFAPMEVTVLQPGDHQLDGQWFTVGQSNQAASRGMKGLPSSLNAILFKNGTLNATQTWTGIHDLATVPVTFGLLNAGLQTSLVLTKPSKVLVTFDSFLVRPINNYDASVDLAIFVNGVQGPTLHAASPDNGDWNSQGDAMVGIVEAPAGTIPIEIRVRAGTDQGPTDITPTAPLDLQMNPLTPPAGTVYLKASISAVVLD